MENAPNSRFITLLQREFREYRNSLFWTPVVTATVLGLLMLGSVILANRISVFGDVLLQAVMDNPGVNVSISVIDDEELGVPITVIDLRKEGEVEGELQTIEMDHAITIDGGEQRTGRTRVLMGGSAVDAGAPPAPDAPDAPAEPPSYEVVIEEPAPEETWNFSSEWRFNPEGKLKDPNERMENLSGRELNPMLSVVHGILILVLLLTTANYLLGSLYDDRKDRSILFWRSMPVSEWQVVLSKFTVAMLVAPLIYIAISLLLQLCYVLLMMVLVWRMGESPFDTVVGNIDFGALMLDPIGGWLLTALWIAPAYAYLLLASAAAKRSPFLMALVPVLALVIAEGVFLGSSHVADAISNHTPHVTETSAVGFYLFGPNWSGIDLLSMASGLVFAGLALAGTVWLRRNRWEL
jgi:hypothetical protein